MGVKAMIVRRCQQFTQPTSPAVSHGDRRQKIFTHVCMCCIYVLAAATIWGWRLFCLELLIVWLLVVATWRNMVIHAEAKGSSWVSNLSEYWLLPWCTYPTDETLVHQRPSIHQLHHPHPHPSQWLQKKFPYLYSLSLASKSAALGSVSISGCSIDEPNSLLTYTVYLHI